MNYVDVSKTTSPKVSDVRRVPRKGIVIHETNGIDSLGWLQGVSAIAGKPASSDYLIKRDGTIFQITKPGHYAFHSGTARWRLLQDSDYTLNRSFVGIELECKPELAQRVTTEQYIALAALVRELIVRHDIGFQNICGHYECALPRGRKRDPQTLNWQMFTQEMINPSPEGRGIAFPEAMP